MDLKEFNDDQKKALFDLLVLGMYADGNLDLIEDEKAKRILDTVAFPSESERQYFLDGSFARARKHGASPEASRRYIAAIAKHFPTLEIRRQAYSALEDSLSSDNKIADQECKLLVVVSEEFKL
ncbi:MAG TPA: hypothetical protein VE344_07265 [Methylomirabilota bacterium]|nr:hypothetical protein [Methylomirabilota bacterium]